MTHQRATPNATAFINDVSASDEALGAVEAERERGGEEGKEDWQPRSGDARDTGEAPDRNRGSQAHDSDLERTFRTARVDHAYQLEEAAKATRAAEAELARASDQVAQVKVAQVKLAQAKDKAAAMKLRADRAERMEPLSGLTR